MAANVRAAREQLGLTRTELAALAGCSVAHLQNIEAGVIPRRGEVLPRVYEVLFGPPDGEAPEGPPDG